MGIQLKTAGREFFSGGAEVSYYDDYVARTPASAKEAERAQAIIPGGVGQD